VLGDQNVGHVALFGSGVEVEEVGAVDEHDQSASAMASIREVWRGAGRAIRVRGARVSWLRTRTGTAFLGEALETAECGDFFLGEPTAAARGDELEDESTMTSESAFVAFQRRPWRQFENAGGTRSRPHQSGRGRWCQGASGHAAPVFEAEVAREEFVRVHLREGRPCACSRDSWTFRG